ncbi:MAG: PQQ-dependent sugar dehydrogenase [Actinomycetota bacterium]|nr:PQQ-dependent sugar dehydrogenase [Actinomycetota bacterium]
MKPFLAVLVCLASLAGAACASGSDEATTTARSTQQSAAPATQKATGPLRLMRVVSGLDSPLHVAATRSEPNRLYVVEQGGRIRIVENGRLRDEPFLDIDDRVRSGGEQGLLSVAFHPNYASNRRFYVNFTDNDGHTNVVEYRSDGRRAIPASARRLLFVRQPYANHNGGQLAFGPDGRLYVGMGDGGAGGDPENRAQNMRSLLGKLLSINVATRGVKIEALGLRNPWRFSFDRANWNLWIADVGQNAFEEIDFTPRAQQRLLLNYGWDVYEGRSRFESKRPSRGKLVFPVATYGRSGGCSVSGGFVYRGSAVPAARGRYFYGDFCSGTVWSLTLASGKARVRREPFKVDSLASFGEDVAGELYLVSLEGTVYRLAGSR